MGSFVFVYPQIWQNRVMLPLVIMPNLGINKNKTPNKNFYNYYAVIPRGTISFYQKGSFTFIYINRMINFYPKKRIAMLFIIILYIPSFIGSFCLNKVSRYFHQD